MERSPRGRVLPRCEECRFHDIKLYPGQDRRLICRVDPPQLASMWRPQGNPPNVEFVCFSQNIYRVMEPGEWCGKFEPDQPTN